MVSKSRNWWLAYIALILVVAVRFVPVAIGTKWLWGVGQLTQLPFEYGLGYLMLAAAALGLPLLPVAEPWCGWGIASFSRLFFESSKRYYARGLFVLVAGLIFAMFRTPTHFLGDGYTYLANIGSDTGHWVKWSEAGAIKVILGIQAALGGRSSAHALAAFQIVSVVSGALAFYSYFLIAQVISAEPVKRFLVFGVLGASSTLLLYFGYVESYPMLWGIIAAFFYFSLKYAKYGTGVWQMLACLFLATGLHLQIVMYWPAVAFILLSQGSRLALYRKYKVIIWGVVAATLGALGIVFVREFRTNLAFENIFLFSTKPSYPDYTLLSGRHIVDTINLLMLVYPASSALLVLVWGSGFSKIWNRASLFLGLLSFGSLSFLLLIDPGLSMPRDWDLFALCWFAPVVWMLYLIEEQWLAGLKRLATAITMISIVCVLPFLLVNLDETKSIAQIRQIIADNPEKSLGTCTLLSTYYHDRGDVGLTDSLAASLRKDYPDFYATKDAFALLAVGKTDEANRLFTRVKPDKFSKDYQSFLSAYNLRLGNIDSALQCAKRAIQLQVYFDRSYALLAYAYMMKGEQDSGIQALRDGYALNSSNKEFIVGLAQINFNKRFFDSTLYYANELRRVDSTDVVYLYLASKGLWGTGDKARAIQFAQRYFEVGQAESGYFANRKELEALMPDLSATH